MTRARVRVRVRVTPFFGSMARDIMAGSERMAERTPAYIIRQQRDAKKLNKPMTDNPFAGHHPRPVSVDTLDGIEAVALAIQQLHGAMTATSETHRFLATTMMGDEVADILRMIQVDQRQFSAQGLRDLHGDFTTRPATEDEIEAARKGRWP
jgi:hypothetical protein